ncbi:MAG: hypothetical protein J5985_00115 [Kiritimatiellae bacterium]|nr:hypothetical protein [Kiritimatiellia bacterium]
MMVMMGIVASLAVSTLWAGELPLFPVQWRYVGPGGGGWIQSLLASRHSPNRMFVGGDVGGFFRSEDAGERYEVCNKGFRNLWIESIAEHPRDPNVLLAGSLRGVYKSQDGGKTWREVAVGFPPISRYGFSAPVSLVVYSSADPDTVYAAIGRPRAPGNGVSQMYRSYDGGESWQPVVEEGALPSGLDVFDLAIHPQDVRRLLISTSHGLFRSTDEGVTWTPSNDGLPAHLRTRRLAQSPAVPSVVYVSLRQKGGEAPWSAGVYRSDDAGDHWRPVNTGLPQDAGRAGEDDNLCDWVDCLAVHPVDPGTVYAGGASWHCGGLFKTTDGGASWKQVFRRGREPSGWIDFWGPSVTCLSLSALMPDTLVFGTSGAVYRSDDAGFSWQPRYSGERIDGKLAGTGLEVTCVKSITPHYGMKGRFYLGYFDIGLLITEDDGKTFRRSVNGVSKAYQGTCFAVVPSRNDPFHLWAGFGAQGKNEGGVAESFDGGREWRMRDAPESGWVPARPLALALSGETLFCLADGRGIFAYRQDPPRWEARNGTLPAGRVTAFALDGERLFAGTAATAEEGGAVWRSDNVGKSWRRVTSPSHRMGDVRQLAVSRGRIVVTVRAKTLKTGETFPGGVWTSADGGLAWTHVYEDTFCDGVAIHPKTPSRFFVGLNDHPFHDHAVANGVIETQDGGRTWRSLSSDSLVNRNISALAVDPNDPDYLWAGTAGNSVCIGKIK